MISKYLDEATFENSVGKKREIMANIVSKN